MPGWRGSDRRRRLPADWPVRRRRVLKRDGHACTWVTNGIRCGQPATDVDHIVNNDDHGEHNLRALCTVHHRSKTGREGGTAPRTIRRPPRSRPPERHPGLLP